MQEDHPLGVYFAEVSLDSENTSKFKSANNPNMWSIFLNSRKNGRNKRKDLF